MKKIIIGLCLLSATTMTYAINTPAINTPERNVPTSVKERFHKDYPDANAVHWKYTDGRWDANFRKMDDNRMMDACYNGKGHRIDTRMPITQSSVPDKVIRSLNEKYPGRYTHHFTKVDRPNKRDLYAVRVKQQKGYRTLYIDRSGHERDYASR